MILEYTGRIDRNGYKYYSSKENCNNCPEKIGCFNKKEDRTITRHICEELNEEMREDDYQKEEKHYINKEKKKLKEVLLIVKTIIDIDMQCIKELKKIKIIHGLFVLRKI